MMTAREHVTALLERQAISLCDELALSVTDLMAEKQTRSTVPRLALLAFTLAAQFQRLERLELASLAATIELGFSHLFDGLIEPGQALPLLSSAISTLRQMAPLPSDSKASASLVGAIYELETLFPLAGQQPPPMQGGPDVRLTQLRGPKKKKS